MPLHSILPCRPFAWAWIGLGLVLTVFGVGVSPLCAQSKWIILDSPEEPAGYLASLLINEVPFPGERGYVSEENTQAAMQQVLWVLHCRIHAIPRGYRQEHVAGVRSKELMDIITGTPTRRQCEGFYRNDDGRCVTVPRVQERIRFLCDTANRSKQPGRFARLLGHARDLSRTYIARKSIAAYDRYAELRILGKIPVTGRAYSWMTDRDYYHPGGNFVTIPDSNKGMLGGNRFFTLRKQPK